MKQYMKRSITKKAKQREKVINLYHDRYSRNKSKRSKWPNVQSIKYRVTLNFHLLCSIILSVIWVVIFQTICSDCTEFVLVISNYPLIRLSSNQHVTELTFDV